MNAKRIILGILAILLVLALVFLALYIWPGPIKNLQAQLDEISESQQPQEEQSTPTQKCDPKPTTVPTATDAPTATKSSQEFAWVFADTKYGKTQKWTGSFTFKGPAVCEWYKDGYPPNFGNEGIVFLMDGEQITFPKNMVGTCWNIPDGNPAVKALKDSYRHLLFYSNQLTADDLVKLDNYFHKWPVIKEQHQYMHLYLETNDLGECTFFDQTGCQALAEKVVQPPNGVEIEITP